MINFRDMSMKRKLLISILLFSLLLVGLVTGMTSYTSYNTMKEQLVYNRRMSVGWLQDRIDLDVKNYMETFYKFEVDKNMKPDIVSWCEQGEELNYASSRQLISAANTMMSMDATMNEIEIFNLKQEQVLEVKRSGADILQTGERLDIWAKRAESLQSSLVFQREEGEIVISHQMYNFYESKPIALIRLRIRPYNLQGILTEIQSVPEENIIIFNDENQIIAAIHQQDQPYEAIFKLLTQEEAEEIYYQDTFWFYRNINGGKLKILLSVPNASIMRALRSNIFVGLFIAAITILISILVSVIFSSFFSQPIIALAQKMQTITIDDYHEKNIKNRKDEIGILQDSFNIMITRNQLLIKEQYKSKLQKRDAQIRALQAQINPHFMYNTLQVIGGMALRKKAPEIYQMTTSLSDIMRYSLDFSQEMVILQEELKYLQSYLAIQNERFDNRLEFELMIPRREFLTFRIPKLILQPLIENSLAHGLANKVGQWKIKLMSELTDDGDLKLIIKDNGLGIAAEKLQKIRLGLMNEVDGAINSGEHVGLSNVHSRIRLRYEKEKYGIKISSTAGEGTIVSVLLKAVKG